MRKSITSLLQGLALILTLETQAQSPCKEVIGYYPSWQWYDRSQLVRPATIDYSKYTILNYAFFNPQANGTILGGDSWADEILLQGQIDWSTNPPGHVPNTSLVDLAHNNQVKVLISVGGWTWSNNFPTIAASAATRAVFAHECNRLVAFYNLDGIDIDWEYPGYAPHGGGPADAANFTLFLQEIRDSLDALEQRNNEQYLLTAAVGASQAHMSNVQWNNVVPLLDMINLMSYDFFGAWDAVANHNNPLTASACGDPNFNISSAFQLLTTQYGVPASKINVGVAFYGRTQTGYTGLCQPTSGNAATSAFPPDGTPLYYDILAQQNNYTYAWDASAQVPYLHNNSGVFVSFDDEHSIALKAQFIVQNNARGAIIWEITGDYIETSSGSGIIAGTPLADTLNAVLCSNPLSVEQNVAPAINIYPNPGEDEITLGGLQEPALVTIISLDGKILRQETIQPAQPRISTGTLSAGSYCIQVLQGDKLMTLPWVKL